MSKGVICGCCGTLVSAVGTADEYAAANGPDCSYCCNSITKDQGVRVRDKRLDLMRAENLKAGKKDHCFKERE